MNFNRSRKKLITHCIAALAIVYLCVPMSATFSEVLHQLSHAISQTSAHHEHTEDMLEDHTHNSISFFDALFSGDDDADKKLHSTSIFNIDKHIPNSNQKSLFVKRNAVQENFGQTHCVYEAPLKNLSPPPQGIA